MSQSLIWQVYEMLAFCLYCRLCCKWWLPASPCSTALTWPLL